MTVTIKNSPGSFRKAGLSKVEICLQLCPYSPQSARMSIETSKQETGRLSPQKDCKIPDYGCIYLELVMFLSFFTLTARATVLPFPNSGQDQGPRKREGEDRGLTTRGNPCKVPVTGRGALTGGVPTHMKADPPFHRSGSKRREPRFSGGQTGIPAETLRRQRQKDNGRGIRPDRGEPGTEGAGDGSGNHGYAPV